MKLRTIDMETKRIIWIDALNIVACAITLYQRTSS